MYLSFWNPEPLPFPGSDVPGQQVRKQDPELWFHPWPSEPVARPKPLQGPDSDHLNQFPAHSCSFQEQLQCWGWFLEQPCRYQAMPALPPCGTRHRPPQPSSFSSSLREFRRTAIPSSCSPGLPVPPYCSRPPRAVPWAGLTFPHGPGFLTPGFSQGTPGRILLPWTQRWPFLKAQTLRPRSKRRNYLSNAKNQWQLIFQCFAELVFWGDSYWEIFGFSWKPEFSVTVAMGRWIELNFSLLFLLRAETETKFWVRRAFSRKRYKYFSCVENGRAIHRGMGISGKWLCPFCLEWNRYQKWDWKEYWIYTSHVFISMHSVYFRSTAHSEWFLIFIVLNNSPGHLVCTGL